MNTLDIILIIKLWFKCDWIKPLKQNPEKLKWEIKNLGGKLKGIKKSVNLGKVDWV